jgi:hypothetical protein
MRTRIYKTIAILMILTVMVAVPDLSGQAIELNGFAGWQFGGMAKLYDGEFRINDAMNYGGKIAVGLSTTTFAEISYMRADTEGRFSPYIVGTPYDEVRFSSNYIHVAGLQEIHKGPLAPFTTIGLGLAVWSPKDAQLNSKTQFSITAGAGLKVWLNEMLGLRVQGSILMPMVYNGFGFGCGIGTGGSSCGSNLYTRITPFQGEISGGIMIRLYPN